MAIKSALDALNASLASNGVPSSGDGTDEEEVVAGEEADDETPAEGEEGADADEDAAEGDEGDEAPAEGEEGADGDEDAAESEEEPAAEGEQETPEAKAAREKLEKSEERGTGDILEDPIPKTLGPRGQERMRTLISTVKELQPDAEMGRELMGHINNSRMTADEFNVALTFGRLKHSDNVEDHRKAYGILWQGLKELAPLIGESLPGVDPLEGHADLQTRVTAKTLDAKDAAEIAAGRNRRKADAAAATRAAQNVQTTAQRAQQDLQLAAEVKKELNALGHELAKNDKHFEAKMATLTKEQRAKINTAPLGLRVNAFLKTYLSLKAPAKAAAPAGKKPGPQPIRAGKVPAASGGGVRKGAKTAVEALNIALGLDQ